MRGFYDSTFLQHGLRMFLSPRHGLSIRPWDKQIMATGDEERVSGPIKCLNNAPPDVFDNGASHGQSTRLGHSMPALTPLKAANRSLLERSYTADINNQ